MVTGSSLSDDSGPVTEAWRVYSILSLCQQLSHYRTYVISVVSTAHDYLFVYSRCDWFIVCNGAATNGLLGKYELTKTCLLSEVPDSLLALELHCPTPKTDNFDISCDYRKRNFQVGKITSCIQATFPRRSCWIIFLKVNVKWLIPN